MLKQLKFEVQFHPTLKHPDGQTIKGDHKFELGLSAITGKNEAGKSLRIEMIRFALFGTKALRGAATTYKSLEVKLDFQVLGVDYAVTRKGTKATLTKAGSELATGTKPVNDAIERVLGYGIDVFDIANACLQGEVEAMTNKRPAERKEMVDRTIGLNVIDEVVSDVSTEILGLRKSIDFLTASLGDEPQEPIKSDRLTLDSTAYETKLNALREDAQKVQYLTGQLAALRCHAPTPPAALPADLQEISLEELHEQARALQLEFASLTQVKEKIKNYEKITASLAGRDVVSLSDYIANGYPEKWRLYHEYDSKVVVAPKATSEELDFLKEGFKIQEIKKTQIQVECPACTNKFALDGQGHIHNDDYDWVRFERLKSELDVKSLDVVYFIESIIVAYNKFAALPVVEKPDREEIKNALSLEPLLALLSDYEGFDPVKEAQLVSDKEIGISVTLKEINEKILLKQKFINEETKYQNELGNFTRYYEKKVELEPQLKELEHVDAELIQYNELYVLARNYEHDLLTYTLKKQAQKEANEKIEVLAAKREELLNVKAALIAFKPKVKSHLIPSLNRVASGLLNQMTNGDRKVITVTDDFDIMVDGQAVETLSGSGKAIANLAVRIGLGTVLTNKVFSVFLADEIDASMDEQRAAYTAACLQNLTKVIGQVILVSHQEPEADHQIKV